MTKRKSRDAMQPHHRGDCELTEMKAFVEPGCGVDSSSVQMHETFEVRLPEHEQGRR